MNEHGEERKKFIQEAKEAYYKIGFVSCPAFSGERVYFKKAGWEHLLRKGRRFRNTNEYYERIKLLKYAEYIIVRSYSIDEQRENIIDGYPAYFWSLKRYIDGVCIWVIIRKLGCGQKHFFSIMSAQQRKNPQ